MTLWHQPGFPSHLQAHPSPHHALPASTPSGSWPLFRPSPTLQSPSLQSSHSDLHGGFLEMKPNPVQGAMNLLILLTATPALGSGMAHFLTHYVYICSNVIFSGGKILKQWSAPPPLQLLFPSSLYHCLMLYYILMYIFSLCHWKVNSIGNFFCSLLEPQNLLY